MQIGSLVESLKQFTASNISPNVPVKGGIYTIRAFQNGARGEMGLHLEELINPYDHFEIGYVEPSFCHTKFCEVQPPMTIDISELQHQTKKV